VTYCPKIANFPYPTLIKTLAWGEPFKFIDEPYIAKTRVLGLSINEDFLILDCVVLIQCQRLTDRQTDIPMIASTELCIASYADAV